VKEKGVLYMLTECPSWPVCIAVCQSSSSLCVCAHLERDLVAATTAATTTTSPPVTAAAAAAAATATGELLRAENERRDGRGQGPVRRHQSLAQETNEATVLVWVTAKMKESYMCRRDVCTTSHAAKLDVSRQATTAVAPPRQGQSPDLQGGPIKGQG